MEPFICPQCVHKSSFDPYKGPAQCPRCGYSPAVGQQVAKLTVRSREPRPEHSPRTRSTIYRQLLDEILTLWDGTFQPEPEFELPAFCDLEDFYADYRWALGGEPFQSPRHHDLPPAAEEKERRARESFVAGYFALRRGDRSGAAAQFHDLVQAYPDFVDAWLWLAAVAEEQADRTHYLEEVLVREPTHGLARDAMAVLRGRVSPGRRQETEALAKAVRCPKCAGSLEYQPGAAEVICAHCGHTLSLPEVNVVDGSARLIGDLRLERRFRGHAWKQLDRVLQCGSCGAELSMTQNLAQVCVFCGSPNVLLRDARQDIQQPDGFLPFAIELQAATEAIGKALRGGRGRLRRWWSGEALEVRQLQGLYLPFWVFDGFVEVRTTRMSLFDRFDSRAMPLVAKELLMFENILSSAVITPPREFLSAILPFDTGTLVPYEPRLLADWPAVLYTLDVEAALKGAQGLMLKAAMRRSEPLVRIERDDEPKVRRSYRLTSATYQLVLLPVWAALLVGQDQVRLGLVNGQTGTAALSRPLRSAMAAQ
jgi:Zn finger protein HypA/HybF involved in hydrogenase expression